MTKNYIKNSKKPVAGSAGRNNVRNRKKNNIATNYALMLQLYEITKEEASANKDVRYEKAVRIKKNRGAFRAAGLFLAGIVPFFVKLFDFISKETKAGITMVTE